MTTNVQVGEKTYPLERVVDAMLRLREDGEARFFDREAWNKAVEEELRNPKPFVPQLFVPVPSTKGTTGQVDV